MLEMGSIAIASRGDATSDEIAEAMAIHAHVEKLLLVVFATRARSCEIIQAILVSTRHQHLTCLLTFQIQNHIAILSHRGMDDNRGPKISLAIRMAADVGLHLARTHDDGGTGQEMALALNDARTKAWLEITDARWVTTSAGRSAC